MKWKNILLATVLIAGLSSVRSLDAQAASIKDTTSPVIPVYKVSKYINLSNETSFEVKGKGEANSTMLLSLKDGKSIVTRSVKADARGNFKVKIDTTKLVEGNINFSIQSSDKAGNKSKIKTHQLVKDITLEELSIDNEGFINSLTQNEYPVSGTADIESNIEITLQSGKQIVIGKTKVDELGNFSVDLNASNLEDGKVSITIKQTDIAGNMETQSVEVIKDTKAPELPVLFQVTPIQSGNVAAYFVNGLGVKNGEVEVTLTDGINDVSTIAPIDENGLFQAEFNLEALLDGEITITVKQTSESGNESLETTLKTLKDSTAPTKPVLDKLDTIISTNQGEYVISGQGEQKATIQVMVTDGTSTITAPAQIDDQGKFSLKVNLSSLKTGNIIILVSQTDVFKNAGSVVTSLVQKQ